MSNWPGPAPVGVVSGRRERAEREKVEVVVGEMDDRRKVLWAGIV